MQKNKKLFRSVSTHSITYLCSIDDDGMIGKHYEVYYKTDFEMQHHSY